MMDKLNNDFEDYNKLYEFKKSLKFNNLCEKEMEKRINDIKKGGKDDQIFVHVEYSDNHDPVSGLEFEIMPSLSCCLATIDHH